MYYAYAFALHNIYVGSNRWRSKRVHAKQCQYENTFRPQIGMLESTRISAQLWELVISEPRTAQQKTETYDCEQYDDYDDHMESLRFQSITVRLKKHTISCHITAHMLFRRMSACVRACECVSVSVCERERARIGWAHRKTAIRPWSTEHENDPPTRHTRAMGFTCLTTILGSAHTVHIRSIYDKHEHVSYKRANSDNKTMRSTLSHQKAKTILQAHTNTHCSVMRADSPEIWRTCAQRRAKSVICGWTRGHFGADPNATHFRIVSWLLY